jgi:hypothetical protein
MASNHHSYIAKLREHAAEARALLSNSQKPERERMVVRAFLRCLGIPFTDDEIVGSKDEPVDVLFRSAHIQVMDVVGDRKRGLDWLRRQRLYEAAKGIADVIGSYRPSKPMPFPEAARSVADGLVAKAAHYGAANCATLDALVYVDLRNRHVWPLQPGPEPQVLHELKRQGWRSASMLFVPYSAVLVAKPGAPEFLREKMALILNACPDPEGLFDA